MANLITDQETGKLLFQADISQSGQVRKLLETENTFVDSDIIVEINTPAATLAAGATTLTIDDEDDLITVSTEEPASGEYITVEGQGAVSASEGGFIAQNTSQNSTAATKYITIQNAAFTTDGASVKTTQAGLVGNNETVGTIGNAVQTITGGGLTPGAGSASATSDGLSDGTAIDATSKVALAEVDAAGYYRVTVSGYGTVNSAAVEKQVTTAGYMAGDANPVTAIAAGSETSNTATKSYYILQSTLSSASVTPSTSEQTVTIGPGYHHESRTVTISAMSAGAATSDVSATGLGTYFNTESSSATADVTITPQHEITTAGYLAATANPVDGTPAYYSIKSQTVTETTTSVNGTSVTRGTRTESAGWKASSETLDVASIANTATNGHNYVDISAGAPVLVAGGNLYINAGWTDDIMISTAHLVPDGTNIQGHADYILYGMTALDQDGNLITGSIPTYDGSYTDL